MAAKMEGKLTKAELKDALFNKMHGNSAPGLDGFTVNWLRTFWQDLAEITLNALNECFTNNGLTGLLKTAIVREIAEKRNQRSHHCRQLQTN